MAKRTKHLVTDESHDKAYFTIVPALVKALARNPYDYVLWETVKEIAGEKGECYLSTRDLATLAMMSTGKVSACRTYWLEVGLLEGELRRDPGYPQPVWHLRIPDFWKVNIEWGAAHQSIQARIEHKLEQRKSLHVVKPSRGEGGIPPGEGGIPPGETNNIQKNIPEGEPAMRKADPLLFDLERETSGHNWGVPSAIHDQMFDYSLNRDYEIEVSGTGPENGLVKLGTGPENGLVKLGTGPENGLTKERGKKEEERKKAFSYFTSTGQEAKKNQKENPQGEPAMRKADPLSFDLERQTAAQNWAVPLEAGGDDQWEDGPVNAFAALVGLSTLYLPKKKRRDWAVALKQLAASWSTEHRVIVAQDVVEAIEALPDSAYSWKTFSSPFEQGFQNTLAILLLGEEGIEQAAAYGIEVHHE